MAWLRRSASRCSVTRPSFRYPTLCLITAFQKAQGLRPKAQGLVEAQGLPRTVHFVLHLGLRPYSLFLVDSRLIEPHSEAQPHAVQDLLDLVQRLAAEVLGLEHLGLGLLHQLANRADVRVLEAVVGPDGQLQLLDALVEILVERAGARLL